MPRQTQQPSTAGLNSESRPAQSRRRSRKGFLSGWRRRTSPTGDLESQPGDPTSHLDRPSPSTSITATTSTAATNVVDEIQATQASSNPNRTNTEGVINSAALTKTPVTSVLTSVTSTTSSSCGYSALNPTFSNTSTSVETSSSAGDLTSAEGTTSAGLVSTPPTSNAAAAPSTPSLPTFQVQGIVLQPHVDQSFRNIYADDLKPRMRAELSRICRRNSWMLEFSMAGDRPEWLTPSILVWCYAGDTKARVKKYFDKDSWLRERMRSHGVSHYILDKPPRRSAKPASIHRQFLSTLEGSFVTMPDNISTCCGLDLVLENGKMCKIGGLITVDGVPYLKTTRHGLDGILRSSSRRRVKRSKSAGKCPSLCSEVSSSVSTDDDAPASDYNSYTSITTPSSPEISPADRLENLLDLTTPQAGNTNHRVSVLYPPVPVNEDSFLGYPADDFDWLLVDLLDAPVALLEKALRPNLVHGKLIQGLHLGEIEDQSSVTVVTAGLETQSGLLSSVYSTLQVEGSLHDVRLITLDEPLPPGSSGTWVIFGDRVCGFIVAVREDLPWAYMIPMQAALDDMKKTLGTDGVHIPTPNEIAGLREIFISEGLGSSGHKAPSVSALTHNCTESLSESQSSMAAPDRKVTIEAWSTKLSELPSQCPLWLTAKSGAGKSTIIRNLMDKPANTSASSISSFLFDISRLSVSQASLLATAFDTDLLSWKPGIDWEGLGLSILRLKHDTYAIFIRNAIESKMKRNWENKKFLARRDLEALLSEERIAKLISEDDSLDELLLPSWVPTHGSPDTKETFARKVATFAPRLLALCIYVDLPLACLHALMENGLDDFSLPLDADQCPRERYRVKWDFMTMVQGGFLAHTFSEKQELEHRQLHSSIVVPIVFDESKNLLGEGGFGRVYKVTIHPDHHYFSNNKDTNFALKTYFQQGSKTEAAFRNEMRALKWLSGPPHPNLTAHLASWTQNGIFYTLMSLARINFRSFLRNTPNPELTSITVSWFLSQLGGLADGLRHIHQFKSDAFGSESGTEQGLGPTMSRQTYTGFHHDIKPENILVFDGPADGLPTLKISDFGSAKFGLTMSGSGLGSESYFTNDSGSVNAAYGAPEVHQNGRASRGVDIWSLGCVFAEASMWLLGGTDSDPDAFAMQRLQKIPHAKGHPNASFWYMDTGGGVHLKPTVVDKLADLRGKCTGRGAFQRLVETIEKLLAISPEDRPDASTLCSDLDAILLQARSDLSNNVDYYRMGQGGVDCAIPLSDGLHPARTPLHGSDVTSHEDHVDWQMQAIWNRTIYTSEGRSRQNQYAWEPSFRTSKWFTRGWTLQELLAPHSVEFFLREQELLGDKKMLEQQIHGITDIPIAALCGAPFLDFPVDQQLRWAAKRNTQRKEDKTYCLLRIINIFMLLIYVEADNASNRLRKKIEKRSGSLAPPAHVRWMVTRPTNPLFTGREDILQELDAVVRNAVKNPPDQPQCRIVISDMGGQGKSEICLQFAHRLHKCSGGVFWIDVSTTDLAERSFLDTAQKLSIPAQSWDDAHLGIANLQYLWLLVLENADDLDIDYQGYFLGGMLGVVLLTSRNEECQQYATAQSITLKGLCDREVQELLPKAARVSQDQYGVREGDAKLVASLLQSHLLALIQAGAYLSRGHCTLVGYPHVYEQ